MPITEIDLQSDSIVTVEDGKTSVRTVRKEDTVISVPMPGFKKVSNIYIDSVSGKLIVIHES